LIAAWLAEPVTLIIAATLYRKPTAVQWFKKILFAFVPSAIWFKAQPTLLSAGMLKRPL
jgi:hypothetical protein